MVDPTDPPTMPSEPLDEPRLRRLIAVGRAFVEELDPDALLDEILSAAQELTGARFAALGTLDGDHERLTGFRTRGGDGTTRREIGELPYGRGILGLLIGEPEPLRLPDLRRHPRSSGFPAGHPPMTSFLGVPIVVRGEPWGTIYLTEKESGPFDEADEEALVILADWAAVAVDNARLHDRLRIRNEELRRVNQSLAATTAIARAIGAETALDRVLELIVTRGRALVDARAMVILLPDGDDWLQIGAAAGETSHVETGLRIPVAGSAPGDVLRSGRPLRADVGDLRFAPAPIGVRDASSALLVPLVFRSGSLGVLVAFDRHRTAERFTADDEELLLAFAASAATAVATAQTVGEQRLRDALASSEQERRRWARELHDETLQGLASLQVRLSSALRVRADSGLEQAVREVLEHVGVEIQKLRTLITELRPAALDELGLAPAVESLAQAVSVAAGLDVTVTVDLAGLGDRAAAGDRLDTELETAVYRIVQEALTNVVKHAGAAHAAVRVVVADGEVLVRVTDDGAGIDPAVVAERRGFGVTGMRERVRLAGGTLRIAPDEGGGTALVARLPVAGAQDSTSGSR